MLLLLMLVTYIFSLSNCCEGYMNVGPRITAYSIPGAALPHNTKCNRQLQYGAQGMQQQHFMFHRSFYMKSSQIFCTGLETHLVIIGDLHEHRDNQSGYLTKQGLSLGCVRVAVRLPPGLLEQNSTLT